MVHSLVLQICHGSRNNYIEQFIILFKILFSSLASVGERRDAKHCVYRRRELPVLYSHMGKQNNIITRKILISVMRFMEQKVIIFRCKTDIRDELVRPEPVRTGPTRPWRSLTTYFSNVSEDTNMELLHSIVNGLKIVVSNFHRDIFIGSKL